MALINWLRFFRANDAARGVFLFRRANAAFQKEMATADAMHAWALAEVEKKRARATAAYTLAINRATALIQRTEPHQ